MVRQRRSGFLKSNRSQSLNPQEYFLKKISPNGVPFWSVMSIAFMDESKTTMKDNPDAKKGVGMFIYFEVDNVDFFYQELKEKNILTSSEPKSWPWGKREFAVKDPDEYKLIFFSNIYE